MPNRSKTFSSRQKRDPSLLILTDQGYPQLVPPEFLIGSRRDRNASNSHEAFLRVNRTQLNALAVEPQFGANRDSIKLRLRPDGVIGAVSLYAPDSQRVSGGLIIQPRFGWNDIGTLLRAVGWSAAPQILQQPLVPGSAREVPPWVLAGPILYRIDALIQTLTRGFRLHEEVRQQPRGQIIWSRYVREQMARGQFHQLPCRYTDLGPDLMLRMYIRWGVEKVRSSLLPWATHDRIAQSLVQFADSLLEYLRDVRPQTPNHHSLQQMLRSINLPSQTVTTGLEALGWIVDERGLAGQSELNGLAWRLTMPEVFERWVEYLVRIWSHEIGGLVETAHQYTARYPLLWQQPGHGSLRELAPDIVIRSRDTVYIVDAKYKGHFEELDDHRWSELRSELRNNHRYDFHQILAYTTLFDAPRIVAVLVYPIFARTWMSLADRKANFIRAQLSGGGRSVEVALTGVPLQMLPGMHSQNIIQPWHALQASLFE